MPPGESQFLAIISGDVGFETPEGSEPNGVILTAPAGSPALTPQTPLTPTTDVPFLAADAPVPAGGGQTYGPYSITFSLSGGGTEPCGRNSGWLWLGWGVSLPE
ncbi:MAG: hypothetical protein ACREQN_08155 [Candidatus Binataceae bacterium]